MTVTEIHPVHIPVPVDERRPSRWREHLLAAWREPRARAGLIILITVIGAIAASPLIRRYDPLRTGTDNLLLGPSTAHWFGTDNFGRDVWSRVLTGGSDAISVATQAVLLAAIVGVTSGVFAGFYRRTAGALIMRAVDVVLAVPGLVLAISFVAFLGPGSRSVVVALTIVYAPTFARVAEAAVLAVRSLLFVQAAEAIGDSRLRIIRHHVLPNVTAPLLVQVTLVYSYALLAEAELSFLGLGTQPPQPSWGRMLSEARGFIKIAPWTAIFPGLAIMLMVVGFNLLGDGLRDALDVRLKDRR
jgi:peptide/nickel transport system permease protein